MAKPRIIIADTEIEYVTRLQLIFVEEFFDKVDLEIVTDETYYEELFSVPQKVDILIVSENLYSTTLQRHNISDIYVMVESFDVDGTDDLNVKKINKYTDRKNIINEILNKSISMSAIGENIKKEPEIILVYSASGGTGKSTIARGISVSLVKQHKKVLYINAERLQTFQRTLKNQSVISSSEFYAKISGIADVNYKDIKHLIRNEEFSYLPPFRASLMSLGLKYEIYEKIALSARKSNEFDYIVVDADTCFDDDKASLMNIADKIIIITNQDEGSVYATNILASNINGIDGEKYIFICNDFDKERNNALVSPKLHPRFSVLEYVKHIYNCELMNNEELSKEKEVQKLAFLVM